MAENEKSAGNVVRCPSCGNWLMRCLYEGSAEINCKNGRCSAALLVTIRDGKTSVTVLAGKKA